MRWPVARRFAGWPLRTRLVAALVALLAALSIVIGLVSVLALNQFLMDRLDGQLTAATARASRLLPGPEWMIDQCGVRTGPIFLLAPGQAQGTFGARVVGGAVEQAAVLGGRGCLAPVPVSDQVLSLARLPTDGQPRTYHLGGDLGSYRLVAARAADGSVIITGLPLTDVHATVYRLSVIVTLVAFLGLVVAAVVGAAIVRLTLRPLTRVATTASRVAELPLDRGEVAVAERVPAADTDPQTEVGQVGAALNRLLDAVGAALAVRHASETRVRQFVADASHELRTPLAAIRGYAELSRRTDEPVPDQVARAMGRVEAEAGRMGTLVDDLLLLARLDSGRPLERQPVDLSRLVVDAVSDARVAGADHRWVLDLPDEPVAVVGDDARLRQVLANLLANARTHTPPGTTVTTRLRRREGDAMLSVADDGPGIPPRLLPEVFERFARGDSSRSRAEGSTGLGLAIVAAVVAAHHGTVNVTSRPGHTEFTVRLPHGSQD